MSYKITRGRQPPNQSKDSHKTASRPTQTPTRQPYSVCPPMNSLMIDVGGIAAISSGESATI